MRARRTGRFEPTAGDRRGRRRRDGLEAPRPSPARAVRGLARRRPRPWASSASPSSCRCSSAAGPWGWPWWVSPGALVLVTDCGRRSDPPTTALAARGGRALLGESRRRPGHRPQHPELHYRSETHFHAARPTPARSTFAGSTRSTLWPCTGWGRRGRVVRVRADYLAISIEARKERARATRPSGASSGSTSSSTSWRDQARRDPPPNSSEGSAQF